ncbi:hybrid sensor histidine kinase/response regulator [Phreatobacter sp.]|uniref:hybrid sensor histidine kinase/response regulator n=1 Tax=Phreatobacter sp. TaxID=1966341 RepID=UPI0025D7E349|nr:PAS domain-containing sensor histidine kinase [Phreatobacter sp.]
MPDSGARGASPRQDGSDLSRRFGGLLILCGLPLLLLVLLLGWSTYGRAEITAQAREHLLEHLLLVAGTIATFIVLALLVWRQFVAPAVALARAAAGQGAADELPAPWLGLRGQLDLATSRQDAKIHQLRAMIDGIPLRTVYVDHDLIYRDANKEFLDFVGKRRDQVIGHSVGEVLGPKVVTQYENMAERVRAGETMRWEGWIDFVEKGGRYLQVSLMPYVAVGDTRVGFLTFTRDLTELKLGEQELARSEALNRAVVRASLDAIIVTDEDWTILEFNPTAEVLSGYSRDDALGMKVTELVIPQDLREEQISAMERYKTRAEGRNLARRFETRGLRKDGSTFPIEYSVNAVRFGEQRLFMAHVRDLTEPQRLQAEATANRERLHQVEKLSAMGSLLAGVAHELNNPLAIVIAQSSLLVEKAASDDVRRRGERIHAAAERCGRIVKSFLAMARQKPPQREPIDINAVASGAIDMVSYGLRSSDIELDLSLAPDLPPVTGDKDLLAQVIANLLINAQQALMDRPAPRRISLRTARKDASVAIMVADNGPGIPDELMRRVFEPYFTTKPAGVGTGIGLSICRNVVEAHGGSVALSNQPSGGARFDLLLPAAEAATASAPKVAGPAAASGLSVLIVDDEADVARSLAEILEGLGHRPIVADRPATALETIERTPVDIIFADLRMPGLDGIDFRDRIHDRDPKLAERTIIVTGDTVAGPDRLAKARGAEVVVLEKPFTFDDVRGILARVTTNGLAERLKR